jgi:hypothetical protein
MEKVCGKEKLGGIVNRLALQKMILMGQCRNKKSKKNLG